MPFVDLRWTCKGCGVAEAKAMFRWSPEYLNQLALKEAMYKRVMECHEAVSPDCEDIDLFFDSLLTKRNARG